MLEIATPLHGTFRAPILRRSLPFGPLTAQPFGTSITVRCIVIRYGCRITSETLQRNSPSREFTPNAWRWQYRPCLTNRAALRFRAPSDRNFQIRLCNLRDCGPGRLEQPRAGPPMQVARCCIDLCRRDNSAGCVYGLHLQPRVALGRSSARGRNRPFLQGRSSSFENE